MKAVQCGLIFLIAAMPAWALAEPGIVAVTAKAERSFEPNILNLNLEIWALSATAKQAQGLAAQQFKDLQKVFTSHGIRKEDQQTESYSLSPQYEYNQKTQRNQLTGFRVSQNLRIILRKVETGGAFMDAVSAGSKATSNGVNIQNIQWESDQKEKAQAELLTEAVQSARAQADILAKAAGTSIRSIHRLQPLTDRGPAEPRMERAFAMKAADSGASTELSPGQVKVMVEVSAEYVLK